MNLTPDDKVENISDYLVQLCHENGIFHSEIGQCNTMDDLIDTGLIDSMGLVYMKGIIYENFSLELEFELFIVELRNIQSIATYLAEQLPPGWSKNNDACVL